MTLIGFVYDASLHCVQCTEKRFIDIHVRTEYDREGNEVSAIYDTYEFYSAPHCDDCFEPLLESRSEVASAPLVERGFDFRMYEIDHCERLFTLAVFCDDYHSGQWSRLYRISCRLRTHYRMQISDGYADECRENAYYEHLVANFGNDKR